MARQAWDAPLCRLLLLLILRQFLDEKLGERGVN